MQYAIEVLRKEAQNIWCIVVKKSIIGEEPPEEISEKLKSCLEAISILKEVNESKT